MIEDLKGPVEKYTDVHYNSRDGDGEFNWRFIFNVIIYKLGKITYLKHSCIISLFTLRNSLKSS